MDKKKTILEILVIVCIISSMGILFSLVDKVSNGSLEESRNSHKEEKNEYFADIKKRFIPGKSNTYTVTGKYLEEDKIDITPTTIIRFKKFMLTLRDNKANKVYEVETSRDFYHLIATNEELNVTESKDGKSIKIDKTGDVFLLGELIVDNK